MTRRDGDRGGRHGEVGGAGCPCGGGQGHQRVRGADVAQGHREQAAVAFGDLWCSAHTDHRRVAGADGVGDALRRQRTQDGVARGTQGDAKGFGRLAGGVVDGGGAHNDAGHARGDRDDATGRYRDEVGAVGAVGLCAQISRDGRAGAVAGGGQGHAHRHGRGGA